MNPKHLNLVVHHVEGSSEGSGCDCGDPHFLALLCLRGRLSQGGAPALQVGASVQIGNPPHRCTLILRVTYMLARRHILVEDQAATECHTLVAPLAAQTLAAPLPLVLVHKLVEDAAAEEQRRAWRGSYHGLGRFGIASALKPCDWRTKKMKYAIGEPREPKGHWQGHGTQRNPRVNGRCHRDHECSLQGGLGNPMPMRGAPAVPWANAEGVMGEEGVGGKTAKGVDMGGRGVEAGKRRQKGGVGRDDSVEETERRSVEESSDIISTKNKDYL